MPEVLNDPLNFDEGILCSVCGARAASEGGGQLGHLKAYWGPGTAHAGEQYDVFLCEPCFFLTLGMLRRQRMVNTMFEDSDEDLTQFGRTA